MYEYDEQGNRTYWLLQHSSRVIRQTRVCAKCKAECAIGETMEYRAEVFEGEFITQYKCFICIQDSG